jgi:hypothetical protein
MSEEKLRGLFGTTGTQSRQAFNRKQVLSYPLNVAFEDGHYLLFKIFEKLPRSYDSPYVQTSQPSQLLNTALTGLRGAISSKISAIRNKLEQKLGKGAVKLSKSGSIGNVSLGKKHGQWTTWGKISKWKSQSQASKDQNVGNVCLYIPPTVSVINKMAYAEEPISPIGALVKGISDVRIKGFQTWFANMGNVGMMAVQGMSKFTGTGGLGQAISGFAINQTFADVIFTGVDYRTFTFEYSFMPASPEEGEEVDDIINTLTYYAMPLRKDDVAMTYELPAVFELEYMYRNDVNQYIMPALSLALESVDVKYGGEKFVTFRGNKKGAQPVRTDVTLTFKELEIADRASIYGDTPPLTYNSKLSDTAHMRTSSKFSNSNNSINKGNIT